MPRQRFQEGLVKKAKQQSSSVLPFHGHGPGKRFVFFDATHTPHAGLYAIVRTVTRLQDSPEPYVQEHRHKVPSYYLFIGDNEDLSGLEAEVKLGNTKRRVKSPCSVFIPQELVHFVQLFRGSGCFVHILLEGNFRKSLKGIQGKRGRNSIEEMRKEKK